MQEPKPRKLQLVDFKQQDLQVIQTGTCDLCYSTAAASFPRMKIRDVATGEETWVDGYIYDWGYYDQIPDIDNIPDFAAWLAKQEIDPEEGEDLTYFLIDDLVCKYHQYKRENVDPEAMAAQRAALEEARDRWVTELTTIENKWLDRTLQLFTYELKDWVKETQHQVNTRFDAILQQIEDNNE